MIPAARCTQQWETRAQFLGLPSLCNRSLFVLRRLSRSHSCAGGAEGLAGEPEITADADKAKRAGLRFKALQLECQGGAAGRAPGTEKQRFLEIKSVTAQNRVHLHSLNTTLWYFYFTYMQSKHRCFFHIPNVKLWTPKLFKEVGGVSQVILHDFRAQKGFGVGFTEYKKPKKNTCRRIRETRISSWDHIFLSTFEQVKVFPLGVY